MGVLSEEPAKTYSQKAFRSVLETCRTARSPRAYVETLVAWMTNCYGFDQALALFYDLDGKIVAFHSVGTPDGWFESYLDYYFEFIDLEAALKESGSISGVAKETLDGLADLSILTINWNRMDDSLFKRRYIDPVGLKSTISFNLCDMDDRVRVAVCLDRTKPGVEDASAIALLREVLPVLNGMYRNFHYKEPYAPDTASPWEQYGLTAREKEVAGLLCSGMRASRISEKLFISKQTTHKHIAHIYRKVGVSSQTVLIVRAVEHRMMF